MTSKILLVDDDTTLLRFLGEYLQKNEFTVTTASSGADALRMAYNTAPSDRMVTQLHADPFSSEL